MENNYTLKAGDWQHLFKYKLKLKEKFNEKIINVENPNKSKVDVEYAEQMVQIRRQHQM